MGLVERDGLSDVDVRDSIAISHAEGFAWIQVLRYLAQTPTGTCRVAGIDQCHPPGLGNRIVHLHLVGRHVKRDIRRVQKVVREELLDHIAFVPAADDEVVNAEL